MLTRTFIRAALPAALLAGLSVAPLGAQASFAQDDGASGGHRTAWLSAAGLTSAAVFASFLMGGQNTPAVAPAVATPSPLGASVTMPTAPTAAPGTGTTAATTPTIFVPAQPEPVSNMPLFAQAGPSVVTTTPEPASLALFGTGILGLAPLVRRRRK